MNSLGIRHPAPQGANTAMQTMPNKSPVPTRSDALALLAGVAVAVAAAGAALPLAGLDSPLRAPCAVFFLLAAPAAGIAAALPRLAPGARAAVAAGGAVLLDTAVARALLAFDGWSVRGAVAAVAALSLLAPLVAAASRRTRGVRK
ncbi:hypothetical protein ABT160_27430 [Streptomyces sp. NPDC001941]|uniref:hypothetical protein n=1 Tax=Streptomyces sp. NPDC001941 TaxID=3154659 RepID=UPI00332F9078